MLNTHLFIIVINDLLADGNVAYLHHSTFYFILASFYLFFFAIYELFFTISLVIYDIIELKLTIDFILKFNKTTKNNLNKSDFRSSI